MSFLSFELYTAHQPVIQKMLMMPASPLNTLCQPPKSQTSSEDSHQEYHPLMADSKSLLMADSKSLATAIRMLIATITNGYALNQWVLPMPHSYLIIMNPIQPASDA